MSEEFKSWEAVRSSRRDFVLTSTAAIAAATVGNTLLRSADAAIAACNTTAGPLLVGTAAVELESDDSMVIAGGILARYVEGQEGKLRAVAMVLEDSSGTPLVIVACDVLMMTRDQLDPVIEEIERTCGIPAAHVLINCTHTHHAPSTCRVHGYDRDEVFCTRVQRAIVQAVKQAAETKVPATFHFQLGQENTVGENSRLLMSDGSIHWIGAYDDAVRPTGPFDPDLPVLAFRGDDGALKAMIFNHSTHTIGAVAGNLRSPAFYGLAAQELETELGGIACFLEGASGSTHRLKGEAAEARDLIKQAVRDALAQATSREVTKLAAIKRPFEFTVRRFDEAAEDKAVSDYCRKRAGGGADAVIQVFREMRQTLAPHRGEQRTTWLQAMVIGDVAIVGVPAECFTKLGMEIKRRSPFLHTCVAELANDWIGYVGDREAYELGGYQVWMGLHSYCEPGTGERMVDEAVAMLQELAAAR